MYFPDAVAQYLQQPDNVLLSAFEGKELGQLFVEHILEFYRHALSER